MSSNYVLTPAAKNDFLEIRRYVRRSFGREHDQRVRAQFIDSFERLAQNPFIGRARPDIWPEPYFFWPLGPSLIAYHPKTKPLRIVRIARASRDWRELQPRA
ncbi:MAG: type II toxin-antitoxin system RelE/ParE family toxin [bacterium]|nr:type II toxin-antitoxin system RelE/ParE family toxin [bacterium]